AAVASGAGADRGAHRPGRVGRDRALDSARLSDAMSARWVMLAVGVSAGCAPAVPGETSPQPLAVLMQGLSTTFQNGVSPTVAYAGSADTTLAAGLPTTNFGNATSVSVDSLDASTNGATHGLVKWDVSAIPSGSFVQSA